MEGLAAGLIVWPLLAGGGVIVLSLRGHPAAAQRVALVATGLTTLLALALLPYVGQHSALSVEWPSGAGAMGLDLAATSLYALLVTVASALLALLSAGWRNAAYPPLSGALMLLTLAAVGVAFLTDHFLARYVALEVVALCVAVAPLIELQDVAGARLSRNVYLILRLGDAGLLVAILILFNAAGILKITPALEFALNARGEAGQMPDATRLGWVVAGFTLAVWVKLGGWPFHFWSQAGQRLALASHAWLYATVMPNLGAYLLYRVTPLLALSPLRMGVLWLGGGSAALAAVLALAQTEARAALVYVWAAQGGLALFAAASRLELVVWWGVLALTPLRLALFLAVDAAQNAESPRRRKAAATLFALAGLALVAFDLLIPWWAHRLAPSYLEGTGVPVGALLVAEAAGALAGIWVARAAWRLFRRPSGAEKGAGVHFGSSEQVYGLEDGLIQAARALRAGVEAGILEQIIALVVRGTTRSAHATYRIVEQGGFEGLLRRTVRAVVALSQVLQRWHTGRLRHNLLWVTFSLALIALTLVLCGG